MSKESMDKTKLAVSIFLFSESIFFVILILTYVLFHGKGLHGLHSHEFLNVPRTGVFTFILLFSSFTMWLSMRGLRKNKHGQMGFWLFVTILLGAGFIYGQATEWLGLVNQDIWISRDLFGASFFTLTGFHGFHVIMGLVMLMIAFGIILASPKLRPKPETVDSLSLYWHFVDGVWIVVFSVIYLAPYFD